MEHGIDVRKVLLDGPPEEKDWDRDSAVDFEEVKIIGGRKPRLNSISDSFRSFRTDSFTDSVSHVNPGFTQEEIPLEVYYQVTENFRFSFRLLLWLYYQNGCKLVRGVKDLKQGPYETRL